MVAKQILRDPNLSHHATRKFAATIDKVNINKVLAEGAEIGALLEPKLNQGENYEVELAPDFTKVGPG